MIIGIDPSDTIHAWAALSGTLNNPVIFGFGSNFIDDQHGYCINPRLFPLPKFIAIEMVASYGMAAGAHVFDTCVKIGELNNAIKTGLRTDVRHITRIEVKRLICGGRTAAKDSNIRAAVIDRFGGPAATKKGGPLHKVSKDVWAAIAVGLAAMDPEAKWYVPAHLRAKDQVK